MRCSKIKRSWDQKFQNCCSNPFPIRGHCRKVSSAFRESAYLFSFCIWYMPWEKSWLHVWASFMLLTSHFSSVFCYSASLVLCRESCESVKSQLVCLFPGSSALCRQNLNFQLIVLHSAKMNWGHRKSAYISVVLFHSRIMISLFLDASADLSRFFFFSPFYPAVLVALGRDVFDTSFSVILRTVKIKLIYLVLSISVSAYIANLFLHTV